MNHIKKKIISKKFKNEISLVMDIKKNKFIYLLALPGLLFFFVFSYLPMIGIIIAFQDFNPRLGFFKSPLVGFKNFSILTATPDLGIVVKNTLFLNTLFIFFGMFFSILIAIFLSEINKRLIQRTLQSIVILPHFISWTVVAMFAFAFLSSDSGIINITLKSMNLAPIGFYSDPKVWPILLVILSIWKEAGFGSVVYLATITGIDNQIYEAATIDGANKTQKIFYITLPLLKNTAILLQLLRVGSIFYGNFGLIYPLVGSNTLLYDTTDIIDTYVYRALMNYGDMGMSAAVGLAQSFVGFLLVLVTNAAAKKLNPEAAIF